MVFNHADNFGFTFFTFLGICVVDFYFYPNAIGVSRISFVALAALKQYITNFNSSISL